MASDPRYPGARSQVKGDRHYWRIRKEGKDIALPGKPGDEAFDLAYNKVVAGEVQVIKLRQVQALNGRKVPEKSFWHAWLILKASPQWTDFDRKTRTAQESKILEFCRTPVIEEYKMTWDEVLVTECDAKLLRGHLERMHAKFKSKARIMTTAIKKLIAVAIKEDWIEPEQDPTLAVKLKKRKHTPKPMWQLEDRFKFENKWQIGTPARLVYSLALYLGNRRSDVANLRWSDMKVREVAMPDGTYEWVDVFEFNQLKNANATGGKFMQLPIPKPLADVLAATPRRGEFILSTEKSEQRSDKALTGDMAVWTEAAGLPKGLTLHGLRRTFATTLSDNGATTVQVQHAMGHENLATTQIYLNESDRTKSMLGTKAVLDRVNEREEAYKRRQTFRVVGE